LTHSVLNSTTTILLHPFDGLFSRTTQVSRHQRGRTILDFTEATDNGVAIASAGPYANYLHLAQTGNHASTSPLSFYRVDVLPATEPTVSKHW